MLAAMRTGRLSISRGHEIAERRSAARLAPEAQAAPVSFRPAHATKIELIETRIAALERLSRLVEQGVLTLDEFRIEKSLVLRHTGGSFRSPAARPVPIPGKSLAVRLFHWRLLWLAPPATLSFSYWLRPDDTLAWLSDLIRFVSGG